MITKLKVCAAAAVMAMAMGPTGNAQAASLDIWSASRAQNANEAQVIDVGRRHHRRHRFHGHRHGFPGAAFALGAIGTIAGIAASSRYHRRYYCDPYYEYCPRRRVYRRYYHAPRYYYPPPYGFYPY